MTGPEIVSTARLHADHGKEEEEKEKGRADGRVVVTEWIKSKIMRLSDLPTGASAVIIKVLGHGGFRRRIMEMGFVRGKEVTVLLNAPLKDPIKYKVMGYEVSLRRSEASMIEVMTEEEARTHLEELRSCGTVVSDCVEDAITSRSKVINIALVGNPNSGKTSLFNALSGGHEHVGNYGGVTVDAKCGKFKYGDYHFNITDLPGTYALSPYSPEEMYVRKHLMEEMPDVVLNAVVASNLERNLYLTTELIDINPKMVIALNMYDELLASGAALDYEHLGGMLGVPMVPVVARDGRGLDKLLDTVIDVYENRDMRVRHIHITHSAPIETELVALAGRMKECDDLPKSFPPRYWALKLLEGDKEVEKVLSSVEGFDEWIEKRNRAVDRIERQLDEDVETAVTNEKYGFISGALKETYTQGRKERIRTTEILDTLVTHRLFGFPIFLLLMWLMFWVTFTLGTYPQGWLEAGMGWFSEVVGKALPEGALKDLLVDGIIGGVGSVLVFLPNILILYLCISFMEDSGYMARAAFIMDKVMHRIGLHGKSFIPLIMGFGCNVPAIMAARTIESRSSRIITILINPFISCSARLPVYILLIGTFFPSHAGLVLFSLYLLGIVVAVVTARVMRKFMFRTDETPFVMELPPYRMPTLNAILRHVWEKCAQYLQKIGGVILLATIVIWFLSYFPRPKYEIPDRQISVSTEVCETLRTDEAAGGKEEFRVESGVGMATPDQAIPETDYANSYLGHIGRFCEPVVRPLGLNWKTSVALLSGMAAKETVVSTLGVLYHDTDDPGDADSMQESDGANSALSAILKASGDFDARSAAALLVFVLLYFPCIATLGAISNETGSWRWAAGSMVYNTTVAWVLAFAVYHLVGLFV